VLREKALPYMLEHADAIEQQLERHGPDEPSNLAPFCVPRPDSLLLVIASPRFSTGRTVLGT
jgi:hypothetical protein